MDRLNELIAGVPRLTSLGLLDCSGGTLATRTDKGICVSSLQAAEELDWQLEPDDFVLFPGEGDASLARAGRRPSHENRLHRAVLQDLPGWNFTYHGHPAGLLAFCYAGRPLPLSATHGRRFGLKGGGEVPVLDEPSKGPEHHAAQAAALLNDSFGKAECGALLLAGDGPVVAAVSLKRLIACARLLETAALAQLHLLRD